MGYWDPVTTRAPGPAGSPHKEREFRVSQPTAPVGPRRLLPSPVGPGRLLPSTASQVSGGGKEQVHTVKGAPVSGARAGLPEAPGAGRHQAAGQRIISLESPESTLHPEMTASKRVAKVTLRR